MRLLNQSIMMILIFTLGCKSNIPLEIDTNQVPNVLDFELSPDQAYDRSGLMYSDQGAWFAFSFPTETASFGGFSGPFLMTQENGIWSSRSLCQLIIEDNGNRISWNKSSFNSYNSHLQQQFEKDGLKLKQTLVYSSGHTALINNEIINTSNEPISISYFWKNNGFYAESISLTAKNNRILLNSTKSDAIGHIIFPTETSIQVEKDLFTSTKTEITIAPNDLVSFTISSSFIFPEYTWKDEFDAINSIVFNNILKERIAEKENQLNKLRNKTSTFLTSEELDLLVTKAHLTLQNNWRIPAGELKYAGLFPSYHYKWFNGFWSWDSWKHAVGLAFFNTDLAKDQMRAMFDFQLDNGFIVDCVYRDTSIEAHNYRDTKPPLAAWAVAKIYEKDKDLEFVREFYPKLKKYHNWWYRDRDHDQDGLCEFGSTDGSLIAAKWESGMDNAIRFDNAVIVENSEGAYSLDQESVDLNAYLYAEKLFLAEFAAALHKENDKNKYISEAVKLKKLIQDQFYSEKDGWFYDTNLEGTRFIKGAGSEGWTPLWANAASYEQASAVMNKMMDPKKFFTKVPFQTMSADHEKFDPLKGYWRGPNWLDQAYFGIKGLKNYGFINEAEKILPGDPNQQPDDWREYV